MIEYLNYTKQIMLLGFTMAISHTPEEFLLPKQFFDSTDKYIRNIQQRKYEKYILLEDNVIPSIVIMKYDRLEELLSKKTKKELVYDRTKLSKAQSMLITIKQRIHFFQEMKDEEIVAVTRNVSFLRLKKNDIIFEQHSTGHEIYYIINGTVDISGYSESSNKESHYTKLTTLYDGQVFGELGPILDEGRTAQASVSSEDAFILVMELAEIENCSNPTAFATVYKNLMKSLARKLIETNNQLYPFIED